MANPTYSFGKAASFVLYSIADLSGSAVKVYLALCCLCGYHDRHVHISYPTLMQITGIGSENTLRKALNELEGIGALCRKSGNVGKANDYYLPLAPPSKSEGGIGDNPPQKVRGVTLKNCGGVPSKSEGRTEKSTEKSYREAQRAQPQGQAGAAPEQPNVSQCHEGDVCPECGAPAVGEGCCPACGWDYGQMSLPTSEPQMCPECGLALQPDGTCWRHGKPSLRKEKGGEGSPEERKETSKGSPRCE